MIKSKGFAYLNFYYFQHSLSTCWRCIKHADELQKLEQKKKFEQQRKAEERKRLAEKGLLNDDEQEELEEEEEEGASTFQSWKDFVLQNFHYFP
jgi:hypothetical protein